MDKIVDRWGRRLVIGVPYAFLILVFSIPFLVVLKISVSNSDGIRFEDLTSFVDGVFNIKLKLTTYMFLASDELYLNTYGSSLKFATINTLICLFIGYPFAY